MKPLAREPVPNDLLSLLDRKDDATLVDHHLTRVLHDDARAFLARPGKALRARLMDCCFVLAGGTPSSLPAAAAEAIELLHGGSLIVDDIEDDAAERRGAPALHRLIGTPRALNTGNWLYFVALARLDELHLDAARARALSRAAHTCLVRCHEGQALDLALRVSALKRAELAGVAHGVSALKTGALTSFAARLAATVAGASEPVVETLARFGLQVGVGLQMLDDLGGFVSDARAEKAREDLRGHRVSWVWPWADEALDPLTFKQLIKQLSREAEVDALRERLADAAAPLGRARIRVALEEARQTLSPLRVSDALRAKVDVELQHLEVSYG